LNRGIGGSATAVLLLVVLASTMLAQTVNAIDSAQSTTTGVLDSESLAQVLVERLSKLGLIAPSSISGGVSVLPGYPVASFSVVARRAVNVTENPIPVYVVKSVSVWGRELVSYDTLKSSVKLLDDALSFASTSKYSEALNVLRYFLPQLSYGIPAGFYDPQLPVGLKQLDIPTVGDPLRSLNPKLLLIVIGFSDGSYVKAPVYIYYFGFETSGRTFDGVYTRVSIVVSVVIDEEGYIYGGSRYGHGVVFYYTAATAAPIARALPLTILYGFIGLVVAMIANVVEFDEEYKYYITVFAVFVIQLFSFIAIHAIAGINLNQVHAAMLASGPVLVLMYLVWVVPYLFISYRYRRFSEELESSPSELAMAFEGLLLAVATIFVALSVVFLKPILEYLVAVGGPGGVFILVVLYALVDSYIGLTLGKLWAVLSKFSSGLSYK